MLMRPHDGRIDTEVPGQGTILRLEALPEPAPAIAPFPAAKAVVHRVPAPKRLWEGAPGGARASEIQDRFDTQPITEHRGTPRTGFQGGEDGGHLCPCLISQQQTDRQQVASSMHSHEWYRENLPWKY